jgi:hypothetical protein
MMNQKQREKQRVKFVCSEEPDPPVDVSKSVQPPTLAVKPAAHKSLSDAIADPTTPESIWVPACLSFGDRPIVRPPSLLSKSWGAIVGMFAATCAVWFVLYSYYSCFGMATEILKALNGGAGEWGMEQGIGFASGLKIAFFTAMPFWALLLQGKWPQRLSFLAMIWFFFATTIGAPGFPALAAGVVLFALFSLIGSQITSIGKWCNASIPKYLRQAKLLAATSPIIMFIAAMWMVFPILILALFIPTNLTAIHAITLAMLVAWPSFTMARMTKSKSLSACSALGVILQTPLIAGLLVGTLIAAAGAALTTLPGGAAIIESLFPANQFGPLQQSFALTKTLVMFAMSLFVIFLSMAGGYCGAWLNGGRVGKCDADRDTMITKL